MYQINLATANAIIESCLKQAREGSFRPTSVAVLDAGGHLIAFQRQDGSSMLRFEIAFGKAYGALAIGFGSRWFDKAIAERPQFVDGLNAVSGGRIVPVPGGVLIRNADGLLLGAVGITGDTSENDEKVASQAIAESGLTAQLS